MAAKKKVKKTLLKSKKKIWVPILAPKSLGNTEIGETIVDDQRNALGKIVSVNLMTLLRDPKKQGINISFKVTDQHSDHVSSIFYKLQIMPSSIKRMVRRNKDRIDHTFKCKTKEGHILVVKPIILTMNKTNKSINSAIRKKVVSLIYHHVSKKTLDEFVYEITNHKIQYSLKSSLSKIYPVAISELRFVKVLTYPQEVKKKTEEEVSKEKKVEENAKSEN